MFGPAGARAEGRKDKFDPKRATNDELLDKALDTEKNTLAKLKQGLATVETTKEIGKFTAAQLQQDTEKMKRIDAGLDEVQSEAALSQVLITRFAKRMATDKIVIAFAFVLIGGLVGIIVYASLNPDQKIFNVPSAVRPNFSAAAAAASQGLALLSATSSPTRSAASRLLRDGSVDASLLQYVPPGTAASVASTRTRTGTGTSGLTTVVSSEAARQDDSSVVGRAQGLSWADVQQPQLDLEAAALAAASGLPEAESQQQRLPYHAAAEGGDSSIVAHLLAQRLQQKALKASRHGVQGQIVGKGKLRGADSAALAAEE